MASTLIGLGTGASLGGYRLERLLGRGETGSTYLAEHVESGRHVALKVVAPALADAPGFRARFLGDCEIAAGLDHPGVLPVYGAGVDGGVLYVATRYVEGSDLGALLREGPIPPEQAVAIVEQVAGALHAAHCSGLVHRDVRPSNILVEAGTHRVYVTDFGLARKPTPDSAPERVAGELLDGRADVYSLAHVLAGCLGSGDPGPEMRRVLARAAADDPSDRFTTTVEFARASRQALPAVAAAPATVDVPPPARVRGRRRRPTLVVAALLLAAGAVAALAMSLGGGHHQGRPARTPATPPVEPGILASVAGTVLPVGDALGGVAALPAPPSPPPVVFDHVADSGGQGVRYRSTPNAWCGRPVPQTDPCWRDVVPGAGAAEGQQLRIYCYTSGASVHGDNVWAKVREHPDEYVPATFLRSGRAIRARGVPAC